MSRWITMLQNVPSADSALERRTAQTEAFWKNCSPGHQRFRKAFENKIYIRPQKRLKIVKVLAMVRLRQTFGTCFIYLAGFPPHISFAGIFPVTTDPAPIIEFFPIYVPFKIVTFAPIKTPSSITIALCFVCSISLASPYRNVGFNG